MSELWQGLVRGLADILYALHDVTEPLFGPFAWGWAIILLTLVVRIFLLPLAIKQTSSMRATQALQPEMTKIRNKYKADRGLMRSDPQRFQEMRQKQNEEVQKLYRERGVNPAASCLPLVAQMPIFLALFTVLNRPQYVPELQDAVWYLIDPLSLTATSGAGIGAWVLIALMGATTFVSQRQMMASNPAMADQPQQRMLLYAMPVLLTVFGINFPAGVLLYWVTTNLWTMGQQRIMFRMAGRREQAAASTEPQTASKAVESKSGESKAKDASAPKGAPTPKRDAARRERAAGNGKAGGGGQTRTRKGKGGSSASARQRRT
jgi:YidC/Oxa1 family membrane protein insertase